MNQMADFAQRLPSVMTHDFSRVPRADIPRSSFDRSHGRKTNVDGGRLVPIYVDEVLPGDTFSMNMTGFARMATPIAPVMDNIFFNTFFFFVPYRLVWDNWERFMGSRDNPNDSIDFRIPQIASGGTGFEHQSIFDHMGIPPKVPNLSVSALPLRAYNLIWNEWFRDENLQTQVKNNRGDGPDAVSDYAVLRRGKRHDYFTSSLPWPQKGNAPTLNLGGVAKVGGDGTAVRLVPLNDVGDANARKIGGAAGKPSIEYEGQFFGTNEWLRFPGDAALQADLSTASGISINALREAFQIQRLLERDARGGTRYTEILRSHFGVSSPDFRLQRPEYLGGGQSPVNIHQVAQTSESTATQPQGSLAAFGTALMDRHGFNKSFTEHGIIIGLVSVRADLTYQQGLERFWSRTGRYDFYWPALSQLGEQAVLNQEIFADGTAADKEIWGYQERYAEYRYKPSQVTSQMRSSNPLSLDVWHLSQEFSGRPHLNATFIEDDPPIGRVIAIQDEPDFICDFYFKLRCARPMPIYGVPGMMDHF